MLIFGQLRSCDAPYDKCNIQFRGEQPPGTWFAAELSALGITTYPSAGNFLLANFGPTGPALFKKLERQGILVRDRSHDMGPGFVRITIGTEKEMRQLLKAIEKG